MLWSWWGTERAASLPLLPLPAIRLLLVKWSVSPIIRAAFPPSPHDDRGYCCLRVHRVFCYHPPFSVEADHTSWDLFSLCFAIMASKQKRVTDPRQLSIGHVMDLIRDIVEWLEIISASLAIHEQRVQCWMAEEKAEWNHPA